MSQIVEKYPVWQCWGIREKFMDTST